MPKTYNKAVINGTTYIDLSEDDVTASDVKSGVYFHDANGVRSTGTMTETDPIYSASPASGIQSSDITNWNSKASGTHVHGNLTNGGDITTTATIASGDRLIINDESASKIANSTITFGTATTTFLRNDGTWATPSGGTDTKTTQNTTTSAGSYRVLVSKSANDTNETDTVGKASRVYINPSAGDIGLYTSGSEDLDTALANLGWTSDVSW